MLKPKIIIPVIIVIASVIFVSVFSGYDDSPAANATGFTYSDTQKIKNILYSKDIFMSSPTVISDYTVKEYCMYFDEQKQSQVMSYCLTSALTDSQGTPLGNLNMGGDSEHAKMALAIIESSPSLNSQENSVETVFETMIQTLVCDCWEHQKPGGFESIKSWINAAQSYHENSGKTTTTSNISGLADMHLTLEITKTDNSYLWTLIIIK